MAALDDQYDVYDYCVKLGLDPDSNRNLAEARAKMYAAMEADFKARGVGRHSGKPSPITAGLGKLFKARYGKYEPDEKA